MVSELWEDSCTTTKSLALVSLPSEYVKLHASNEIRAGAGKWHGKRHGASQKIPPGLSAV